MTGHCRIALAVQPLSRLLWLFTIVASLIAIYRQLREWCCGARSTPDGTEMPEYAALHGPETSRWGHPPCACSPWLLDSGTMKWPADLLGWWRRSCGCIVGVCTPVCIPAEAGMLSHGMVLQLALNLENSDRGSACCRCLLCLSCKAGIKQESWAAVQADLVRGVNMEAPASRPPKTRAVRDRPHVQLQHSERLKSSTCQEKAFWRFCWPQTMRAKGRQELCSGYRQM